MAPVHPTVVSASILGCDLGHAVEEALSAAEAGAQRIHADVMDGHFVPNLSFGPDLVARVAAECPLPVTAHLMVERPEAMIAAFTAAGAARILVHPESTPHVRRAIDLILEAGVSAGISLNPGTPLSAVEEVLLHIEQVLLMTVNPGWGGQKLIVDQLHKVRELRRRIDSEQAPPMDVGVDGGISPATAWAAREAGANVLVVGTALFSADDRSLAVRVMLGEAHLPQE